MNTQYLKNTHRSTDEVIVISLGFSQITSQTSVVGRGKKPGLELRRVAGGERSECHPLYLSSPRQHKRPLYAFINTTAFTTIKQRHTRLSSVYSFSVHTGLWRKRPLKSRCSHLCGTGYLDSFQISLLQNNGNLYVTAIIIKLHRLKVGMY